MYALISHPEKCTGCGLCATACAMAHEGMRCLALSRIRIHRIGGSRIFLPVFCQHCQDAPCQTVCPAEAITVDAASGCVRIDYKRCISCQMCLAACPFGAVAFDDDRHRVFKCHLCDGDPLCVRFCFPKALAYVPSQRAHVMRQRSAAFDRISGRHQNVSL